MLGLKTRVATAIAGGALMGWIAGCGGGGTSEQTGTGGTGGGGAGGTGSVMITTGDYQPLTAGATWTYHVNDKGVQFDKHAAIEGEEEVPGKAGVTGIKMRETMPAEGQLTWYQRVGTLVVRHREQGLDGQGNPKSEQSFDPYRIRVDETPDHMAVGAAWDFSYTETASSVSRPTPVTMPFNESWKVDAVDEPVSVPAGTFNALKLTHVDPTDSSTKTYWFVRGVGKVREQTSGGHVEELTESNQIPAAQ